MCLITQNFNQSKITHGVVTKDTTVNAEIKVK